MKELEKITNKDIITRITTRSNQGKSGELKVFDETKLTKIANDMVEIDRSTNSFGRKNTQTTNKLMTLTMLANSSPYRILRQCLAEIEKKRSAIKGSRFKLIKKKIAFNKLEDEVEDLKEQYKKEKDPKIKRDIEYQILNKKVSIEEKRSSIEDSILYIEGALKEIASFQSSYNQIRKNNNIPENWDEKDFEESEIKHHVRMAFLLAFRDVKAHGKIGMGTLEYLHQFGIHPDQASIEVALLQQQIETKLFVFNEKGQKIGLKKDFDVDYEEDLEQWLDSMVSKYEYKYLKVLKRIGIDNLIDDWYMYREDK
jgi:hypothetical protein